jgi:PAS domain S-box-containing protein
LTTIPILVVDDDHGGRYIKTRALRAAGFDVAEAGSAAEAMTVLPGPPFQVAVLDVKLPDMHGFELCRVVKARVPSVAVLQTSATFTSTADRVAGLDTGADAYLVEPMEETELVATVRALIRVRQAEAALRNAEMRFAQFAHASPDILWIFNPSARRFEFVSLAAKDFFGHSVGELQADPDLWFTKIHAADRAEVVAMMTGGTVGRDVSATEYRIMRADGVERWVRDQTFVLPAEGGDGLRIGGLARDITDGKLAEQQRELLIAELNHRVKNTLAIVQSIASHTRHASSPKDFEQAFNARLSTLAKAHDLLTRSRWSGTPLRDVIDGALAPFVGPDAKQRIMIRGPDLWVAPNIAVLFALAFHELATNATKYGALSSDSGQVEVTWAIEAGPEPNHVELYWREREGPQVVPPSRKGFGTLLIERVLRYEAEGQTRLSFPADGAEFYLQLPLSEKVRLS